MPETIEVTVEIPGGSGTGVTQPFTLTADAGQTDPVLAIAGDDDVTFFSAVQPFDTGVVSYPSSVYSGPAFMFVEPYTGTGGATGIQYKALTFADGVLGCGASFSHDAYSEDSGYSYAQLNLGVEATAGGGIQNIWDCYVDNGGGSNFRWLLNGAGAQVRFNETGVGFFGVTPQSQSSVGTTAADAIACLKRFGFMHA